jgi:hypothetical protein
MRLMIWVGDEGPTDLDLKDGDIWAVQPDAWTPGAEELKKWLVIQTAEYGGDQSELVQPEYTVGSPDPVIRRMRKYYVAYWEKLTPDELALVRDKTASFAVLSDRFDVWDITRK